MFPIEKENKIESLLGVLLLSGLISIQERKALLKMFHVPQTSSFVLTKMMKDELPKGAKVINDFEKILKWLGEMIGERNMTILANVIYLYYKKEDHLLDYIFYQQDIYYFGKNQEIRAVNFENGCILDKCVTFDWSP